jgi:hypothetical protein
MEAPNPFRNNGKNSLLHMISATPIDSDKMTYEKISECICNLGFEVHESVSDVPGARGHTTIVKYGSKNEYSFIDVSEEKKDRGFVYVYASKERMPDLGNTLSKTLGVQFKET